MATVDPQAKHWTRDEYYRMGEAGLFTDQRVELIDGEILTMSPMKAAHAAGVQLTASVLTTVFGVGYCVRVQLPLFLADDSEPEPDIAVVSGSPRDYAIEHPRTALLVIEVSESTLAFDRGRKSELYAEAGVDEYWVVNLIDRCLEVFREPAGNTYQSKAKHAPDDSVCPLAMPGQSIRVADLLP